MNYPFLKTSLQKPPSSSIDDATKRHTIIQSAPADVNLVVIQDSTLFEQDDNSQFQNSKLLQFINKLDSSKVSITPIHDYNNYDNTLTKPTLGLNFSPSP